MFTSSISSISSLYPVIAYSSDDYLFFMAGKTNCVLGFAFITEPLSGIDESIADRLQVFLNQDFPLNSCVQFSLLASPYIEDSLQQNEKVALALPTDNVLQKILRNKNEFFRAGAKNHLHNIPNPIRNYSLLIAVNLPCIGTKPLDVESERAAALRISVAEILRTAGFNSTPLTNDSFLKLLVPFFNASDLSSWHSCNVKAEIDKPLVNQLFDYDNGLKVFQDHLELGGYHVNSFSIKRMPEYVFFGQALKYPADILTGARGIHVPFIITATIHYPDASKIRSQIATKRQWVINQAYGPLVKFLPKLALRKHGFDLLYEQVENGERPLKLNLTVITFCKSKEQADMTSSAVRTYYKENGYELMPDKYYCLPIFLNSLPFGADYKAFSALMRFKTFTTKHILPLLPIFADSKGTGTSVLNLVSRSGQLMNTSIYDSSTNYNLCIAAQSGSGKSFLVNEILVSFLARGASCYVIDVGRSYEKLCHFLGGDFLAFGMNSQISLNPFDCVRDYSEEADMLIGLISAMIAPTEKLSDFQSAELKRITGELYKKYANNLNIDLLATELLNSADTRVKDMGTQLYAFTVKGEYGRFFSGHNTMNFNSNLTVLELEELKGRKQLQQVVLLQLIYQIQQNMYAGKRDRPKIIIIDEAWDLLRDGDIAKFIETGYRRFRKYGGAAVTVTQSVNDLYNSEVGCAIAENSASMYLLGQKAETVESLARNGRLPLSGGEYELLKSVHTISGSFSEIFLITEKGNGLGRLIVDPFRRLLYSTKASEVNAIDDLLKSGFSLTDAIEKLIKDYGLE